MKIFTISKRNGSRRTIYAPSPEEKEKLRRCLPALSEKQEQVDVADVAHGFRSGRSPVTNAMQHVGFTYTLSFDLKDFFDSVFCEMMPSWLLTVGFYYECYLDEHGWDGFEEEYREPRTYAARQGLPTSPLIANIAAARMDERICLINQREPKVRRMFSGRFVYTRYADDLTFSFNDETLVSILKQEVPAIVTACGFAINEAKTTLQCSKAGRRIITGIAVDNALHPTRAVKRRLRAMLHQGHNQQAQGLAEWASLKIPKAYRRRDEKPKAVAPPQVAPVKRAARTISSGEPVVIRRRFTNIDDEQP